MKRRYISIYDIQYVQYGIHMYIYLLDIDATINCLKILQHCPVPIVDICVILGPVESSYYILLIPKKLVNYKKKHDLQRTQMPKRNSAMAHKKLCNIN